MVSHPCPPPFAYYGSKMTIAERIVRLLPAHGHYVEPFAGSASVLLAKPRSKMETLNDIDGELVNFWRTLRDRPDDLIRVCTLTPHARAEVELAKEPADDPLERARRKWVLLTQTINPTRPNWQRRINPSVKVSGPEYLARYVGRMVPIVSRLAGVSLECCPALDVIKEYGDYPDVAIYADPPYVEGTRDDNAYAADMRTEEEHRALFVALHSCKAAVVLSGYDSELYRDLYEDWDATSTETISLRGVTKKESRSRTGRREMIWSNRPFSAGGMFDSLDFGTEPTGGETEE